MDAMQLVTRISDAWHTEPSDDATARRIVDAATRQLELFGIQRTTMEDVARRAGVSRVTVHRHFATKDLLVEAVVHTETRRFLAELGAFVDQYDSLEDRIVEGFGFAASRLRRHTLLRRLLDGEPELFLPQLTTGAGPLIAFARTMVVDYAATRLPHLDADDVALGAELGIRVIISLVLAPDGIVDLDDRDRLRDLAHRFLPMAVVQPPPRRARQRG